MYIKRFMLGVTAFILMLSPLCAAQAAVQEDPASGAGEEKREQSYIQTALLKELLAGYDLIKDVPEDAPWQIRVNQGTCTVTVYRVLQVPKEELPFEKGYDAIVEEARKEARQDAEQEAASKEAEGAAARSLAEAHTEDPEQEEGGERKFVGELKHVVLRELRRTDAPAESDSGTQTILLPVYACPCSVGEDGKTPGGTFTVYSHLRWHELVGPTWGQWCCHFAPSYLFHSLPYENPNDPNSLQEDVYNLLGQPASHGCVRLAAVDAKYIYDHIPNGSKVEIFTGDESEDPLGKPKRPYVGEWEKSYDPTDPEYQPDEDA